MYITLHICTLHSMPFHSITLHYIAIHTNAYTQTYTHTPVYNITRNRDPHDEPCIYEQDPHGAALRDRDCPGKMSLDAGSSGLRCPRNGATKLLGYLGMWRWISDKWPACYFVYILFETQTERNITRSH